MIRWPGSAEELESRIRPFFRSFIPQAIGSGLLVAVVTYSSQTQLIAKVLNIAFPLVADQICIRGSNCLIYFFSPNLKPIGA